MSLSPIEAAAKRSGVLWVHLDRPRLAWHVWHAGAIHLVTGGGEQSLPGLTEAAAVRVTLRGDNGARIPADGRGTPCAVQVLEPGTPAWAEAAPALVKERLNAPEAAGLAERWAAAGARIVRLTPA